jgi:hypothetical protein
MLRDYLVTRKGRVERETALLVNLGHNQNYADRVEHVVCRERQVTAKELRKRCRAQRLVNSRAIIFFILWQPSGYRTCGWLGKRYNLTPWGVQHGIGKVLNTPELKQQAIYCMTVLEKQIEDELFGPVDGGIQ